MSDAAKRPPAGFDGKDTVWLVKPVDAYGDMIDKLVFRHPNLQDLEKCGGMPFKMFTENDRQFQAVDMPVIISLAARLGNVPRSAIQALGLKDGAAVTEAISSFFNETEPQPTSSTVITMSRGDGVEDVSNSSARSALMNSSALSDRRSA